MSKNTNLHGAKRAKQDEFYTQLTDIEKELKHYKKHFRNKVVFCNCDDPTWSDFWRYFEMNFEILGLKRLIATHYDPERPTFKLEKTKNGVTETPLTQNGDFRSPECVELLKEADIVVTNPPFSLFREYVAQLVEHGKKFLIIGNMNAITYKETFPLLKENKMWLGVSITSGDREFEVPKNAIDMEKFTGEIRDGRYYQRVMGVRWFTNLDHKKRHEEIILYQTYTPQDYPTYDNYDAIEVSKVKNIPLDYDGAMGVPISFMDKYSPEQFEIIWTTDRGGDGMLDHIRLPHTRRDAPVVKGKGLYKRIIIRNRNPQGTES